jgi:acetoin utilization protein AcuB
MRGYSLRVKEIMDNKHPFIYEDDLATKARATIRNFGLRILPVTDKNKKLLGVVSRGDILTISSSVSPLRAKGVMTLPKKIATTEDDAYSTVKELIQLGKWYAPVVNSIQDKIYVGVLGLENFIEAVIRINPEKLAKPVSEIMSKDVATCSPEDEIDNIWRLMQTKAVAGLPVVKKEKLAGIVTQKDLLDGGETLPTFEAKKGRFRTTRQVSSIMKTEVITVNPEVKVISVAKVMVSKDIGRVPVTDKEKRLIGMVDREDVARLLVT